MAHYHRYRIHSIYPYFQIVYVCYTNHMYLRVNRQKRKDGSYLAHFQIAHNTWDSNKQRSRVSIIHSVGRTTDTKAVDGLKRLANSILARCAP